MKNVDPVRKVAPQCSTEPRASHDRSISGITLRRSSLRKPFVLIVALASLGIAMQAPAANPQQERMRTCNAQAKSQTLSGAERKDFMKRCLSGHDAESADGLNSQQRKMKSCNSEANSQGLKGAARKNFMRTCLKRSS